MSITNTKNSLRHRMIGIARIVSVLFLLLLLSTSSSSFLSPSTSLTFRTSKAALATTRRRLGHDQPYRYSSLFFLLSRRGLRSATALPQSWDQDGRTTTTSTRTTPSRGIVVSATRRSAERTSSSRLWSSGSASGAASASASTSTSSTGTVAAAPSSTTGTTGTTATPTTRSGTGNKRLATGMAFLTGWADMMLSAKLATFCSMMTGNLLWMLKAIADGRWMDCGYYTSVLMAYGAGLALYRIWQRPGSSNGRTTMLDPMMVDDEARDGGRRNGLVRRWGLLPTIGMTVAALFLVADILLGMTNAAFLSSLASSSSSSIDYSKFLVKWIPACCLSFGFALINNVGTDTAGTMTFVITGHMTKLVHAVVDDFNDHKKTTKKQKKAPNHTDEDGKNTNPKIERLTTDWWWWGTIPRLRQQQGVVMNFVVLLGFMGGAAFANLLRIVDQRLVLSQTWTPARGGRLGQFGYIGVCMGVLFWWKDYMVRKQQRGPSAWTDDTTSSGRDHRRWRLANVFRRQSTSSSSPLWIQSSVLEATTPIVHAPSLEVIAEDKEERQETKEYTDGDATTKSKTMINGTWYSSGDTEVENAVIARMIQPFNQTIDLLAAEAKSFLKSSIADTGGVVAAALNRNGTSVASQQ